MILRKPYAFFIKIFKPLHLMLSVMTVYLIILTNDVVKFLNKYIYTVEIQATSDIINPLLNKLIYIIPLIIMGTFILFLGVMYKKNKPTLFYVVGIFSFLVVCVINIYANSFLNVLVENIVSVKSVKLIHDLAIISLTIDVVFFILLFSRGVGLDFKKFDFNSDITRFEINDSDKEEFEVNIDIDFNERKRKRNSKFRQLKYIYTENKFLINLSSVVFVLVLVGLVCFAIYKNNQKNVEGVYYDSSVFKFKVNRTLLIDEDYSGKRISDNYLVVVDFNVIAKSSGDFLYLNDFSLKIENIRIKPTKKYNDLLIDLGSFYEEQVLTYDNTDYLIVFEIPRKYSNSEMLFSYNSVGDVVDVSLNPKKLETDDITKEVKLGETLVFEGVLSGVEFKVSDYNLADKFIVEYNFCIKKNDCILSREYLIPSIDENYDKSVLKLFIDYTSESKLGLDDFYKLILNFGSVSYKVNGKWYNDYKLEDIRSNKKNTVGEKYIGVNSEIVNAESIKLVFLIRGSKYEYVLK